jgi:hypothetical protein
LRLEDLVAPAPVEFIRQGPSGSRMLELGFLGLTQSR